MPLYEELDSFQKKAFHLVLKRKGACILFEQGVGKTHPTVALIEHLQSPTFVGFVVCRLSNLDTTWLTLLKKHIPQLPVYSDFDEFKVADSPKLYLVNYDAFRKKKLVDRFLRIKWTFGAFDESQDLKARGSKQSRAAGRIKDCEYRMCLSGTPIDDSPIDMYAQIRFAVPSLFGNDRSAWTRFDERFLKPTGYMGYQRKFGSGKQNEFIDIISPYCLRVSSEEAHEAMGEALPPCHTRLVGVRLLGEQREIYDQMEETMVAFIETQEKKRDRMKEIARAFEEDGYVKMANKIRTKAKRVTAGLKITQMIKLQQITGGFVVDDEGLLHVTTSAKLRKLKHLIRHRVKLPVVIFCKYTEEREQIERLLDKLDMSHRSIHGKIKDKKKNKRRSNAIRLFQRGKLDAMVCQVKAGGVGVDLFAARTGIFFSTTFSYIDFQQAKKRFHRRGQIYETELFFIYGKDTIDEDIYSAILSKQSVSKIVFKRMKQRRALDGKSRKDESKGRNQKSQTGSSQERNRRIQIRRKRFGKRAGH